MKKSSKQQSLKSFFHKICQSAGDNRTTPKNKKETASTITSQLL